ncbi:MAG TPA: hypothetical protein VGG78_00310 [Gemmatimonadaceae bacterium]
MTGPGSSGSADPRAVRRAALRKATLQLVAGVVLLDAVALGLYYLAGIAYAPERTRTIFVVVWTLATALVVALLLKRVRAARYIPLR